MHPGQNLACQIRAATAGDDRVYLGRAGRCGDERGRGTGAGAEQPQDQGGGSFVAGEPVGQRR